MLRGKISPNLYFWDGDPTGTALAAFNPPKGAIVVDVTTPAVYVKDSVRNANSQFAKLTALNPSRQLFVDAINGNDSLGASGLSYATAQAAFNAALAASGNFVIVLGVGTFAGIVLSAAWPSRISIRGQGSGVSLLGGITCPVSVSHASGNAFSATITSDQSVNLGTIDLSSYSGTAGSASLTNCVCGNIYTGGDNGGGAGWSGTITLVNCVTGNLFSGDFGGGRGGGGRAAEIGVTDSRVGNISTVATDGAANVTLLRSISGIINTSNSQLDSEIVGSVILTDSITENVVAQGLVDFVNGGAVTMIRSHAANISTNYPSGTGTGIETGGAVTLKKFSSAGNIATGYSGILRGGAIILEQSRAANIDALGGTNGTLLLNTSVVGTVTNATTTNNNSQTGIA